MAEQSVAQEGKVGGPATKEAQAEQAEADRQAEAELDAFLDGGAIDPKIDLTPKPEAEAKPDRERDEHGKFKKADAPDEPTSETPKGEATEEATEPSQDVEVVNSEEYRRALQALQFDKVPKKVLDSMDPNEIIEWGSQRAKNHADVDRIKSRASELERTRQPAPAESEPAGIDMDEAIKPLVEFFGDESKDALKAFGESILAQAKPQDNGELRAIQDRLIAQERSAARKELSDDWGLSSTEAWNRVLNYRLADQNDYESEQVALETACKVCLTDQRNAERTARKAAEHRDRANGTTTAQVRGTTPPNLTDSDRDDQIFDALADGRTEDAKRISARSKAEQGDPIARIYGKKVGVPDR